MNIRELRPDDWPDLAALFGAKGACGGCWCMFWRIPHGGRMWQAAKGEPNRKAMMRLVKQGEARGMLAFDGDRCVGWCSFGRRVEFPRTETMKAYRREDTENVWSINCFFIHPEYRHQGMGYQLAEAAVKAIRKRKGKIVEAYPVPLTKDGAKLPAAFVYTGPEALFRKLGFREVQRFSYSRPLYRLTLD